MHFVRVLGTARYPFHLSSSALYSACALMLRNLPRIPFPLVILKWAPALTKLQQQSRGRVNVVWCTPSCLRVTFSSDTHCSGRPQRWASGIQRGLWPADDESRGEHPCTATATLGPQVTNHFKKKTGDAKKQSGVQWPRAVGKRHPSDFSLRRHGKQTLK